eukprot:c34220_g1_i1 orf=293-535(+)
MAGKRPPWVQQELKRRHLQMTLTSIEHAEYCVGKEMLTIVGEGIHGHGESMEAVEGSALRIGNDQRLQDDIAVVALLKAC